ncbi:hypothetical protein GLW00_11985 [Halobacillus litoralis]|uniref:DUF3953 domain-containing protein n=1 Tax=Halobacillus litoralis TaxID=45668 RepID=A0A845FCI6_9BACI|nr:hypothetical protein [Halobacillus litoralis]MYL71579.1 hypothetical protein [Halobacillus litoralis]
MNVLKKVNFIFAIIGIGLVVLYFFIEDVQIPKYGIFSFLLVTFLLLGIEKVKDQHDRSGYLYVVTAIVMSLVVIKELVNVL